ncbi:putative MFS-type transporter YhhS [Pseudomonas fluorescens]|uniref:Putative MFS-type transporter YhhS n=2 Tax=Pseudomonas fluorescens TaxID=294 RepID=A0A5E6PF89_PSEFL|nr:putative MFS-type transporter YhhS [Pseudomonas fluorescens]
MMSEASALSRDSDKAIPSSGLILSIIVFNFISYVCSGLPLAVLPGFVLNDLGLTSVFAGIVISSQYLATLLARPLAGGVADRLGAKYAVVCGLSGLMLSGALTALALFLPGQPWWLILTLLMLGRLVLGASTAMISTPCCTWAIGLCGAPRAAQVMSWNGIAAYGGTAVGAPLGVLLGYSLGIVSVGLCTVLLGFTFLLLALGKRPAPLIAGTRMAFHRVLFTVMPNGLVLICSSVGFGGLTAFVALYFDSLGWDYAAWCLSGFGVGFILARLSSPGILQRFRGYKVVAGCLLVQTLGMLLIWLAPSPALAIAGGVLTGAGVSWVYPGLGVETLARTPPANRNSALSGLSLFFDVAVGVAGPVMGLIASGFGYAALFFCAAVMSAGGFVLVIGLCWRSEPIHH